MSLLYPHFTLVALFLMIGPLTSIGLLVLLSPLAPSYVSYIYQSFGILVSFIISEGFENIIYVQSGKNHSF